MSWTDTLINLEFWRWCLHALLYTGERSEISKKPWGMTPGPFLLLHFAFAVALLMTLAIISLTFAA